MKNRSIENRPFSHQPHHHSPAPFSNHDTSPPFIFPLYPTPPLVLYLHTCLVDPPNPLPTTFLDHNHRHPILRPLNNPPPMQRISSNLFSIGIQPATSTISTGDTGQNPDPVPKTTPSQTPQPLPQTLLANHRAQYATTATSNDNRHDNHAFIRPRFVNYREVFNHLFHNKGVDYAITTSLWSTQHIEPIVELIAFILDRPGVGNAIGNDNNSNNNGNMNNLGGLLPGFETSELATIEFLGLGYGRRSLSPACSYLLRDFMSFTPDVVDLLRIIRSRTDWSSQLSTTSTSNPITSEPQSSPGDAFRDVVMESPFRAFKNFLLKMFPSLFGTRTLHTLLLSYAYQLAFTEVTTFWLFGDYDPMRVQFQQQRQRQSGEDGQNRQGNGGGGGRSGKHKQQQFLPPTLVDLGPHQTTLYNPSVDSINYWFGTGMVDVGEKGGGITKGQNHQQNQQPQPLHHILDLDSLSTMGINTYSDYFHLVARNLEHVIEVWQQTGNYIGLNALFLNHINTHNNNAKNTPKPHSTLPNSSITTMINSANNNNNSSVVGTRTHSTNINNNGNNNNNSTIPKPTTTFPYLIAMTQYPFKSDAHPAVSYVFRRFMTRNYRVGGDQQQLQQPSSSSLQQQPHSSHHSSKQRQYGSVPQPGPLLATYLTHLAYKYPVILLKQELAELQMTQSGQSSSALPPQSSSSVPPPPQSSFSQPPPSLNHHLPTIISPNNPIINPKSLEDQISFKMTQIATTNHLSTTYSRLFHSYLSTLGCDLTLAIDIILIYICAILCDDVGVWGVLEREFGLGWGYNNQIRLHHRLDHQLEMGLDHLNSHSVMTTVGGLYWDGSGGWAGSNSGQNGQNLGSSSQNGHNFGQNGQNFTPNHSQQTINNKTPILSIEESDTPSVNSSAKGGVGGWGGRCGPNGAIMATLYLFALHYNLLPVLSTLFPTGKSQSGVMPTWINRADDDGDQGRRKDELLDILQPQSLPPLTPKESLIIVTKSIYTNTEVLKWHIERYVGGMDDGDSAHPQDATDQVGGVNGTKIAPTHPQPTPISPQSHVTTLTDLFDIDSNHQQTNIWNLVLVSGRSNLDKMTLLTYLITTLPKINTIIYNRKVGGGGEGGGVGGKSEGAMANGGTGGATIARGMGEINMTIPFHLFTTTTIPTFLSQFPLVTTLSTTETRSRSGDDGIDLIGSFFDPLMFIISSGLVFKSTRAVAAPYGQNDVINNSVHTGSRRLKSINNHNNQSLALGASSNNKTTHLGPWNGPDGIVHFITFLVQMLQIIYPNNYVATHNQWKFGLGDGHNGSKSGPNGQNSSLTQHYLHQQPPPIPAHTQFIGLLDVNHRQSIELSEL